MDRLLKNIGLALLFLVAALILLNFFVIMPMMSLQSVQTSPVAEPISKSPPYEEAVVSVDTLAVIKRNGTGEGAVYIDPEDENTRNPFFWPGEKFQQQKAAEQAPSQPQLSMVIIGEGRRQALLGDAFVKEGDMYHGFLVKRIEEDQVILVDSLGELRIHLAAGAGEKSEEQAPVGLIEKDRRRVQGAGYKDKRERF